VTVVATWGTVIAILGTVKAISETIVAIWETVIANRGTVMAIWGTRLAIWGTVRAIIWGTIVAIWETVSQSCRTRVLDLDSSRTRVRFLADLDLDLDITCLQTTAVHLEMNSQHERDLNKLHQLAMSVLSVPATSAAVGRVFSHGGLFMRPHRARMSDKLLSTLVFLKCNMWHWQQNLQLYYLHFCDTEL